MDAHVVQGELDVRDRRVSDVVADPNVSVLALEHATWQDLLTPADNTPAPADNARVRKEMARLIVPEDDPFPLAHRAATQPLPIHIGLGLFTVDGMIHRRVGDTSPVDLMLREHLFVPITNAMVRYGPNGEFDAQFPVVLVNTNLIQYWTGPRG
jgi:hypothetical protein